jgi:hypothetical protein
MPFIETGHLPFPGRGSAPIPVRSDRARTLPISPRVSRAHLARLYADGSLDTTFFNTGSGANGTIWCLAVQPDGRIVIGGDFSSVSSTSRPRLGRLNSNGTVDGSFAPTNKVATQVPANSVPRA